MSWWIFGGIKTCCVIVCYCMPYIYGVANNDDADADADDDDNEEEEEDYDDSFLVSKDLFGYVLSKVQVKDSNSCFRYYQCDSGDDFRLVACPPGKEFKKLPTGGSCDYPSDPYCHV